VNDWDPVEQDLRYDLPYSLLKNICIKNIENLPRKSFRKR